MADNTAQHDDMHTAKRKLSELEEDLDQLTSSPSLREEWVYDFIREAYIEYAPLNE